MEGRKEEEEIDLLHHFSHDHPLSLIYKAVKGDRCYGCYRFFAAGEVAYGCSKKCGYKTLLHEECAEMPREIVRHPMHPQHVLIQKEDLFNVTRCAVCRGGIWVLGYYCTSADCKFQIHLECARDIGVIYATDIGEYEEKKRRIKHPSDDHQHELKLLRRPCSFKCDACGTKQKEKSSYVCKASTACQYWIHESCASLPDTLEKENLHHHPLSLAFHVPKEYNKFEHKCDICHITSPFHHWVYHCQSCSYVVHIKCAINTSPPAAAINTSPAADTAS